MDFCARDELATLQHHDLSINRELQMHRIQQSTTCRCLDVSQSLLLRVDGVIE